MPRPGQNSGRSSSGHSSNGRSSSGHRISSSTNRPGFNSRPTGSSPSFSSGRDRTPNNSGYGSGYDPGYNPYPRRRMPLFPGMFSGGRRYRDPYTTYEPDYSQRPYGYTRRSGGMGSIVGFVVLVILIVLFLSMCGCASRDSSANFESSYNRDKLQTAQAYDKNCITDNQGWFENIPDTEKRLKAFYDKTGVQPRIVINAYNPALKTDEQKSAYAREYYDQYITDEDSFLYMYFPDQNSDSIGYMEAVNGKNISAVMDDEAVGIFWDVLDTNWRSDLSTDDLFVNTFNTTADRIMTKSATGNDVMVRVLGVLAIVAVGVIIIVIMMVRRKHEREKAEETERILRAPIRPEENESDEDLINKYGG